jgi:hypothetical protein
VAVGADIERETLVTVLVESITNSNDKFAGTGTLAIGSRQGNLVDCGLGITLRSISVGITSNKAGEVDDSVGLVTKSEGSTGDDAEKLGVGKNDIDGRVLGAEPSVVAVTLRAREEVCVLLELGEVLAHVGRVPGVVASQLLDVVEIAGVGVDCDEGIVGSAATKCSGTRVQSTLHLRARWGAQSSVLATIGGLVGGLEVASLPGLVGVVLDEEVPCKVGVFGNLGVVGRDCVIDVLALVITSFDEKRLVTCNSEPGS